ncbi:MAG: hypothetical protein COA79_22335 [Planctomycetota bacterium]|nr:MAG: hypothetical protein COA79_22335 [Planctomycetota bacterium]
MKSLKVLITILIMFLSTTHIFSEEEKSYQVKLTRVYQVGQKFSTTKSFNHTKVTKITSQGKVLKEKKKEFSAKTEGTLTVLEIDELKGKVKFEFLVKFLSKKEDGKDTYKELIPEGTRILFGTTDSFKINGKYVNKSENEVLDIFFSLPSLMDSEDFAFGTKDSKTIGSIWEVNKNEVAKLTAYKSFKMDSKDITGSTIFKKIQIVDGNKCLKYFTDITIGKISVKERKGMKTIKSTLEINLEKVVPADVTSNIVNIKKENLKLVYKGKRILNANSRVLNSELIVSLSKASKQILIK